jgi:hypothetical protein
MMQGARSAIGAALAALLLVSGVVFAQEERLQIEATPVPGQLDVLQGTAIQLGGKPGGTGRQPEAYHWDIVEGEGGRLMKGKDGSAIFQAPVLEDKDLELFIIELTAMYGAHPPARVRLHLRVHRELPEELMEQSAKAEVERKMREQASAVANRPRTRSDGRRTVARSGPSFGFGFSWGWGWPVYYPVYVPIVVPPPGGIWEPGIGDWEDPVAVPYDDLVTNFPEAIADDYLPQDFPYADELPPTAHLGGGPGDSMEPDLDFMDIPQMEPPMAEPGFGGFDDMGGGFGGPMDMPMIEPDFGFDDFGW